MVVNLPNNAWPTIKAPASPASVNSSPAPTSAGKPSPRDGNEPPASPPIDTASAIEHLDAFISDSARGLRFSVDPSSGDMVVTVVNPNNGKVIRQIPSEEMLRVANALREYVDLHLVDDQA